MRSSTFSFYIESNKHSRLICIIISILVSNSQWGNNLLQNVNMIVIIVPGLNCKISFTDVTHSSTFVAPRDLPHLLLHEKTSSSIYMDDCGIVIYLMPLMYNPNDNSYT